MSITFKIDGVEVKAEQGQTIMQAADAAGIYIPRLCFQDDLKPHGSCRICTVMVNGRPQAACTQPVANGITVESETEAVTKIRSEMVEMLLVEGNHFCPFCEKSGDCELQALAYRFGIMAPKYRNLFPKREVDASHPDVFIDHNCCVLCGRCVEASKGLDGKNVFQFVGRGAEKKVSVNAEANLADTDLQASDKSASLCPVGAIVAKRQGYHVPIGERTYDNAPIGSDIEARKSN